MIPEDPDSYLYLLSPFDVLGTISFLCTLRIAPSLYLPNKEKLVSSEMYTLSFVIM